MTLIETLNNIHLVGDSEGLTFTPDNEGNDFDPDDARIEVAAFIHGEIGDIEYDDDISVHIEAVRNLCIYGAALFDAIDNHDADPSDHDPKG